MSSAEHEIEHQEADSLLDYIKLIFHEDMGEGHLEHVVVGQFLNLDINSDFIFFSTVRINETSVFAENPNSVEHLLDDFTYKDHLEKRFLENTLSLRGPPALI